MRFTCLWFGGGDERWRDDLGFPLYGTLERAAAEPWLMQVGGVSLVLGIFVVIQYSFSFHFLPGRSELRVYEDTKRGRVTFHD